MSTAAPAPKLLLIVAKHDLAHEYARRAGLEKDQFRVITYPPDAHGWHPDNVRAVTFTECTGHRLRDAANLLRQRGIKVPLVNFDTVGTSLTPAQLHEIQRRRMMSHR